MLSMGIVDRTAVSDARDWSEYRLTRKGWSLFPVIHALMSWGDAYAAPNGPPVSLEHKCGHAPGYMVVCQCCGDPLKVRDIRFLESSE
jgi:hypothetical protein